MIQIRKNVFETNSSSSHSLVVSKKKRGYDYILPINENGVLIIPFGEFGWGPNILDTPFQKLCYLVTDRHGITDEIKQLIKSKCPYVKDIQVSAEYGSGYIDHQSVGTTNGVDDVEQLIFNKGILILIDNDNNCYFSSYDVEQLFDQPKEQLIEEVKKKSEEEWERIIRSL